MGRPNRRTGGVAWLIALACDIQLDELLLQEFDTREVGLYIVASAPLVGLEAEPAHGKIMACSRATKVNHRGEILLLSR